jgi:Leucine-rich repeat (LRR) protein
MKIDWTEYSKNEFVIDLSYKGITEIKWEGCPVSLKKIYLDGNQIEEMKWEGCPHSLHIINLSGNQIKEMKWEGCPQHLIEINLDDNQIKEMNWKSCTQHLNTICLSNNQIEEMNWEGCSDNIIYYDGPFEDEYYTYKKKSKAARIIQNNYLRHYTKRKYAAKVITEGCHNWVWKPLLKDGTNGIRLRLDLIALGLD